MRKKTPERSKYKYTSPLGFRSFDICLDDTIKTECRNCGVIYNEPIKICEVCGCDVDLLPNINIELPNNSVIGDKYAIDELANKIAKHIYEELP